MIDSGLKYISLRRENQYINALYYSLYDNKCNIMT